MRFPIFVAAIFSSSQALRAWLFAPLFFSGVRYLILFFTLCLLLRFLSPLAIRAAVALNLLPPRFALVASAASGEFVAYDLSAAGRAKVSAAFATLKKNDFPHFTLRFEDGPSPTAIKRSFESFASIAIREDPAVSDKVYGKASLSPAGDPEIRLNSYGTWLPWTITHEAEHWRLLDPCVQGWFWAWLPFCIDLIPAHDARLFLHLHLFPGGDWVVLIAILIAIRFHFSRPL